MKLRFRLWHLFAVVAGVAAMLWVWLNVEIEFIHVPPKKNAISGTYIGVGLGNHSITLYNSLVNSEQERLDYDLERLRKGPAPKNKSN